MPAPVSIYSAPWQSPQVLSPGFQSLCAHYPPQAHLALLLCLLPWTCSQEAGKLSSLGDTVQVIGVLCHSRVSVKEVAYEQGSKMRAPMLRASTPQADGRPRLDAPPQ